MIEPSDNLRNKKKAKMEQIIFAIRGFAHHSFASEMNIMFSQYHMTLLFTLNSKLPLSVLIVKKNVRQI